MTKSDQLSYFASTCQWVPFDYIPGNVNMFFARLPGAVPMGLTKLTPGGVMRRHWHDELEQYLIIEGGGRFEIGTEQRQVEGHEVLSFGVIDICHV